MDADVVSDRTESRIQLHFVGMVDNNVMYCAEQIKVPTELGAIFKQYSKQVLIDQPEDLNRWSANYFAELAQLPPMFAEDGSYIGPPLEEV